MHIHSGRIMASSVVVFVLLKLLLEQCTITSGSTHWIVTEDGRLQSQADSVFNLRRPYDLVAFMRQEERAYMLGNLKKELLSRKSEIDRHEDRDSAAGLEQKFYQTDPDCIEAGKPLPEFDLYISTVLPLENKGIRPEEHVDLNVALNVELIAPDCQAVTSLDFSIHAFEHLEGLKDRRNLSGTPELGLKNAITHRENVDEYGHLVYEALHKNTTSWILYNMAAFYWRIKGEPFQAIECIRRALHYSPRHQKDVALISLANILHRARYSNEAAILVHSALDLSRELNVNHFTLGNIYAVLGEYNKSIICFENTLKIQPEFEAAASRKHAVLCHSKLEAALEAQHRALQKTLKELKDYQKKYDIYQTQNEKLATEQVSTEVKITQRIAYEHAKMRDSSNEMGEYCRMVDREGKQVLLCTWSRRTPDLDFDFAFLDNPVKKENLHEDEENNQSKKSITKDLPDYAKPMRPPRFSKNRPPVPKFQNSEEMMEEWPSKDECDTYVQKVPDPRNLSTVYLSAENKGFEVKALLTEAQGLGADMEHPLPWYPPVCVPLMELPDGSENTYDHLKSVSYAERSRIPLKHSDPSMRKTLLEHVNGGSVTEEEVGQRILTAIRQMIGPQWVLYNLAGLYWRVIGNSYHGIECLRRALHLSPPEYRDVPLNNLANILYRWGRIDDALAVMRDAVNISDVEPVSNLLYAHLLWASSNYTGAMWHYRHALEIQPDLQEAFSTLRALRCYLKYHQAAQSIAPVETPTTPLAPNCGQKPGGGSTGVGSQTDSRVICKTENGEEKCIIETRLHNKAGNCNGQCTQTCTITPIKLDTCTGLGADVNLDGLQGGNQCGQKGQQFSPDQEELLFSGDFTGKLDEVSEYYEKRGLCQGEECSQLRVQGGQKPHVKLEYVEGVLHRKLIFLNAPGDLHVEPHECVIFNDGARSLGCSRSEFRTYLDGYSQKIDRDMKAINILLSQELVARCLVRKDLASQFATMHQESRHAQVNSLPVARSTLRRSDHMASNENLPDTSIYIAGRFHLMWNHEECSASVFGYMSFDFKSVTSTWLPVTAMGVNLADYLDFGMVVKHNFLEPLCTLERSLDETPFDRILNVAQDDQLQYAPEMALREVLQTLGEEMDPSDVMGTRIATALNEHPTSWVLANLAALHWRMEGHSINAVNCLRVALVHGPRQARGIPLISLANILHQGGHLDDAVIAMAAALDVSREIVVAQFTLANIYAAKEEWTKAAQFYESTLALQPTFQPARERLKAIMCQRRIS